ncbi:hypothetical protein [Serinicoccus sp. CNJ-927]|nr:hypothetical protein [Serinicoccus sp. CNJ-927]
MDDLEPLPAGPAPTRDELLTLEGTGWDGSLDALRQGHATAV